ncbi:MAG TPA: hypothetical protein VL856_09860 [Acidimicrobiia bacterium]|jgi:hypothetical protein|nr:hypothetical protein [Acidimicrobiia bacterium]
MIAIVRRLVFEFGTGRAAENARREQQDLELVHARIEAIGRRIANTLTPESDTEAA